MSDREASPAGGGSAPGSDPGGAADARVDSALRRLVRDCFDREIRSIEAVKPGLGTRRFARLRFDAATDASGRPALSAIARIDAPEDPRSRPAGIAAEPPLESIRAALETAGLPVPARYASDTSTGIVLLEDLGDDSLHRIWPSLSAEQRRNWVDRAAALIPQLQRVSADASPHPPEAFERHLDSRLFRYKAEQLVEHGLPFALDRPTKPAEAEVIRAAFRAIADEATRAPQRLAHRDFKAANLHVCPADTGDALRLVMIDLQGAFLAPPEYDLVCLLRDIQVDVPDAWIPELLPSIGPRLPDAPPLETLEQRFTLLTLSRVGKDFSRYALYWQERGDPSYGRPLPQAARMLAKAATDARALAPEFERLADLLHALDETAALTALRDLSPAGAALEDPACAR